MLNNPNEKIRAEARAFYFRWLPLSILLAGAMLVAGALYTQARAGLADSMMRYNGTKPIGGSAWCGKMLRLAGCHECSPVAFANLKVGRPCKCSTKNAIVVFKHSHVGVSRGKVEGGRLLVVSGNARGGRVSTEWRKLSTVKGCRCR